MPWYGWLVILAVIALAVVCVVVKAKKAVRNFSGQAFGTNTIAQGLRQQKEMLAETPKSLKAMTGIFLPRIERDFPEFHYEHYKEKSENMLRSYISAVALKDASKLLPCARELENKTKAVIEDLKNSKKTVHSKNIVIHDTQISNYIKKNGNCYVEFQSAVGYIHYVEDEKGEILEGDKNYKTQTAFTVTLAHIQNEDELLEHTSGTVGLTCPNCGAPIKSIGQKFCDYCGTGVREINIHTWKFIDIEE